MRRLREQHHRRENVSWHVVADAWRRHAHEPDRQLQDIAVAESISVILSDELQAMADIDSHHHAERVIAEFGVRCTP